MNMPRTGFQIGMLYPDPSFVYMALIPAFSVAKGPKFRPRKQKGPEKSAPKF
jgi:hypothetical protein